MSNIKSYTADFMSQVPAMANRQLVIDLNNERRRCKIKSIFNTLLIQNDVTGELIPYRDNKFIDHQLFIRAAGGENPMFGFPLENPSDPSLLVTTGRFLRIIEPGQLFFHNVYFNQKIEIVWNLLSFDLFNGYNVFSSVVIEIEEE